MSSPIVVSELAEIDATCEISFLPEISRLCVRRFSTTAAVALSMPRLRSIGLAPAVTLLRPAWMIDCASTVAVVVPSPATSLVFEATSLTIWAPTFSSLSSSSISFATVTPSLVTVGAPNFFSTITLRPFGPSVTLTALASLSTPRFSAARASVSNTICFAISLDNLREGSEARDIRRAQSENGIGAPMPRYYILVFDDSQNVAFTHDEKILTVYGDFGTGILAVEHRISLTDTHIDLLPVLHTSRADRYDGATLGLLLRGIGNVESALGLVVCFHRANDDAIAQGLDGCHDDVSSFRFSI